MSATLTTSRFVFRSTISDVQFFVLNTARILICGDYISLRKERTFKVVCAMLSIRSATWTPKTSCTGFEIFVGFDGQVAVRVGSTGLSKNMRRV